MDAYVSGFLVWLQDEGRSRATIRKYRYNVEAFCRWLNRHHHGEPLTRGILREFGLSLKERSLRPATQHGYAAAISNFLAYLRQERGQSDLPDASALAPDTPDAPERICPAGAEVQALLRAARQMPAHTIRAAYERGRALTIVGLACLAGLRRGEILALDLKDVEGGFIRVRRGKGGKGRRVPVSDDLHVILEEWLRTRAAWVIEHRYATVYLLPTRQGKRLSENGMATIWTDLRLRAGVTRQVTPHGGRHWFGSEVAGAAGYVEAMEALGHTNLATTQRYLHSDPAKLAAAVQSVGRASQEKPAPKPPPEKTRRRSTPNERRKR